MTTANGQPRRRWFVLAMVSITLTGGAIRVYDSTHSLWLDELHTAWCVADGAGDVAARARVGNHSPLYFFLVYGVVQATGLSEWALRLPSLLAGVLLVPATGWLAVNLTGNRLAGLFAALLSAMDVTSLYHSQDARMYALVQLAAVLHVGCFWSLARAPTGWKRAAFITFSVALFYLHYTAVLVLLGELIWYLIVARPWRPARGKSSIEYRWHTLSLDLLVIGLSMLPALWHLREIAALRHNWRLFVPEQTLASWHELFTLWPLWAYALPWVVVGVTVAVLLKFRILARPPADWRRPRMEAILLLACWFFIPLLAAWLATASETARLYFPRYLVASAAALPVAAAWLAARLERTAPQFIFMLLVVLALGWHDSPVTRYVTMGSLSGHYVEDWRGAVEFINRHETDERPVLMRPWLIEAEQLPDQADARLREYLLFPARGIYRLPGRQVEPLPNNRFARLAQPLRQKTTRAGGAWFLVRDIRAAKAVADEVQSELRAIGLRPQIRYRGFRGVVVVLAMLPPDAPHAASSPNSNLPLRPVRSPAVRRVLRVPDWCVWVHLRFPAR